MKIFLAIYLVLFSGIFANAQVPFQLKDQLSGEVLSPYIEIHEDLSGKLDFESIQSLEFSPLGDTNMGYSSSVYWLKFQVSNPSPVSREYFLLYDSSLIDRLELYDNSNLEPSQVLGDRVSFNNRKLKFRNPVFVLEAAPSETKLYYIKIQSESTIPIAISAYSRDEIMNHIITEQIVFGLYYGCMVVMILYNLFLYISTRIKSYLFYVLFISSFALFQFILNGLAFQYLWSDSFYWANHSLLIFMVLSTVFASLFTSHFLKTRHTISWLYRIYQVIWAIGLVILAATFLISYSLSIRIETVFSGFVAIVLIINGILAMKRGIREAKIFIIAFSVFVVGALLYTLKSGGILPSNGWTNWTIQLGSAIQVVLLSLGLADRINELSLDLKKRNAELHDSNKKLQGSEHRFRELFHGVSEIIFVLDADWNFIDVNRAITKNLGFKKEEIQGKNILELIYKSKDIKDTYNRIFVMEKLEELHDTGNPVDFQAEFKQKYVMEPKELWIKLQYVQLDDKREILGTASVMVEDILGRFMQKERIVFNINNYLRNAEIISQKLSAHISKFSDMDTLVSVRTTLREILINAIEHGNLNISFEEKSKVMMEGSYLQFIQNRQNDPRYKDKKVTVEYVLDSKKVAYRITDEGQGFDHKKMMDAKMEDLNEDDVQHGRGIIMTRSVFDIIEYNDKGNQVSLVKYFR
jgi:PAS domain S-box-containing protein